MIFKDREESSFWQIAYLGAMRDVKTHPYRESEVQRADTATKAFRERNADIRTAESRTKREFTELLNDLKNRTKDEETGKIPSLTGFKDPDDGNSN